jgi:hypothetical protein
MAVHGLMQVKVAKELLAHKVLKVLLVLKEHLVRKEQKVLKAQ